MLNQDYESFHQARAESIMSQPESRFIESDGLKLHALTQGCGPLVLMTHGFPGLAYAWRHQMAPLAEAGFTAVALDMLGYGHSDRPLEQTHYEAAAQQRHLAAVLDHFGAKQAIIIGQDFGAQYAWNFAVRAPERVRAIIGMVPYDTDLAGRALRGSKPEAADTPWARAAMASASTPPSARFAEMAKSHFVHVHYFQTVGSAEAELGAAPREFLKRLLFALSAEGNLLDWYNFPSEGTGYLDTLPPTPDLPWPWFSAADLDVYEREFMRLGAARAFIGGLNSYRTADANWVQGAPYADANVLQPALVVIGAEDPVLKLIDPEWQTLIKQRVPDLRGIVLVPGAGHNVQQEQPAATTAAILDFIKKI